MWKICRENLNDFPDIPSDLSEPAYALLVFDNSCMVCTTLLRLYARILMPSIPPLGLR